MVGFTFEPLQLCLVALIGYIGLIVSSFSLRYMRGDANAPKFFLTLAALLVSLIGMVCLDQIFWFLGAWCVSNLLLVNLMIHKPGWRAARASGRLAAKNYLLGALFLAGAFFLLYRATGETSLQQILQTSVPPTYALPALALILLAAMTQSAIWPFHRWLVSSLNSPTPVSAVMHAGLVNGGGFLLIRFAPLLILYPAVLQVMFVLGVFTAIVGTLWKLLQPDVKRMLACSTMGQMGFMVAQCGMGLFPAAFTHLCWHGAFKAYLFLASGGAAQEKRLHRAGETSLWSFLIALLCGIVGSWAFIGASHGAWLVWDTRIFVLAIAAMACVQSALTVLGSKPFKMLPVAAVVAAIVGAVYGINMRLIESLLAPVNGMQPQPLGWVYLTGLVLLVACWLFMVVGKGWLSRASQSTWLQRLYVRALNASQPAADTVTAHRNHYSYE